MVETLQKVEVVLDIQFSAVNCKNLFATQIDFICTLAYDKFDYLCPT